MSTEERQMSRPQYGHLLAVDYAILEMLPDEGQMIGYKPIALQVRSIKGKPGFEEFSGGAIAGRLKSMEHMGLVVTQVTLPLQRGLGWQRTAAGRAALERNGRAVT